ASRNEIFFSRLTQIRAKLAQHLVFVLHFRKLATDFCSMVDHIFDRWTVLAFEPIHSCYTAVYLCQALIRRLDAACLVSQTGPGAFRADATCYQLRHGSL